MVILFSRAIWLSWCYIKKSSRDGLAGCFSQEIVCLIAQGPEFDPQHSQEMVGLAVLLYPSAGESKTGRSPGLTGYLV